MPEGIQSQMLLKRLFSARDNGRIITEQQAAQNGHRDQTYKIQITVFHDIDFSVFVLITKIRILFSVAFSIKSFSHKIAEGSY